MDKAKVEIVCVRVEPGGCPMHFGERLLKSTFGAFRSLLSGPSAFDPMRETTTRPVRQIRHAPEAEHDRTERATRDCRRVILKLDEPNRRLGGTTD